MRYIDHLLFKGTAMNVKLLTVSVLQKGLTYLHPCLTKSPSTKKTKLRHRIRLTSIYCVYLISFSSNALMIHNQQCFAKKLDFEAPRTLNRKLVNQYTKMMKVTQRSLINSLNQLEQIPQKINKSHKSNKAKMKTLRRINKYLNKIYQSVTVYFQAERSQKLNLDQYLKLRKRVWQLLDRKLNLFQSSQGRFCLRAYWERLIAQSYLSLNHNQLAQHHFLRAYRCDGSADDFNKAKNIQLTIR